MFFVEALVRLSLQESLLSTAPQSQLTLVSIATSWFAFPQLRWNLRPALAVECCLVCEIVPQFSLGCFFVVHQDSGSQMLGHLCRSVSCPDPPLVEVILRYSFMTGENLLPPSLSGGCSVSQCSSHWSPLCFLLLLLQEERSERKNQGWRRGVYCCCAELC